MVSASVGEYSTPHQQDPLSKNIPRGVFVNVLDDDPANWRSQVDWASRIPGRSHLELWLEHVPRPGAARKALRSLLADETILVHAPFVGLSLCSDWRELRAISVDRLCEGIDFATELSARVFTVHPGPSLHLVDRETLLERLAGAYLTLQEAAGPMAVAVENMPDRQGVTREAVVSAGDFRALLDMVPQMTFTLDVGHAQQNRDRGYAEFLRVAGGSIVNIHLHDAIRGGRAHLPLGEGEIDVDTVMRHLAEIEFGGYLTLETLNHVDTERSWLRLSRT